MTALTMPYAFGTRCQPAASALAENGLVTWRQHRLTVAGLVAVLGAVSLTYCSLASKPARLAGSPGIR